MTDLEERVARREGGAAAAAAEVQELQKMVRQAEKRLEKANAALAAAQEASSQAAAAAAEVEARQMALLRKQVRARCNAGWPVCVKAMLKCWVALSRKQVCADAMLDGLSV